MESIANQLTGTFARLTSGRRGYVLAVDQGTTSTRCIVFDGRGTIVSVGQLEHRQLHPGPGMVEHDPEEIIRNTRRVMADAVATADISSDEIAAVGITNQRETTVIWDRETGEPVYNAIVWQDTRTEDICSTLDPALFRERTGLPVSTYFSGPKIRWILDNVEGVRERAERGELAFGTMDSWIVWELTRRSRHSPGQDRGRRGRAGSGARHVTDVTNASRTMLMDLRTQQWDEELCEALGVPVSLLPEIVSSSEVVGRVRRRGPLHGVPIAGILGDQQAATFGQACTEPGEAKNTYGTGNFLLLNTGTEPQVSDHGLLTTVAYRLGNAPTVFALEGSVAVTGSLVQWLRDNLGFISSSAEVEELARSVDDNGGCYIVPAFSGLLAPRWRPEARGVITGLTGYVTKAHIARAALEATAFQTREVVEAMNRDSGVPLTSLRVDGGMVANDLLMQFQADQLGVPVTVPAVSETTALGAAYAAGLAVDFFRDVDEIRSLWQEARTYTPQESKECRDERFRMWNAAVERTFDWPVPREPGAGGAAGAGAAGD
ncbi:glycerol kinase [Corynebacterium bovis]|uniref:Glycerol kinase n=1 Tax=Corynebacterium bovis TaxID=36808 RepID=A0A3R8PKQ5_9CORY|nr:glycerol kinase [Corynebacterium bovis]RRO97362.1 glycerol kinase [Corynebacterium bovis]RRO97467.1 glycerol kinase [Corynebacterium bovis]RRQ01247.1 glycerol kinase [Corynebacterium bovis]RRQ01354.1 glycerol kinase [Corynebacterium bovis]